MGRNCPTNVIHAQVEIIKECRISIFHCEVEGALARATGPELQNFIKLVEEKQSLLVRKAAGGVSHGHKKVTKKL